jgi:anti-sigma factor RsiW
MHCDQDTSTLAAYLDGELAADQLAAAQEHIAHCTHCAAEVAEVVRLKRNLRPAASRFAPSADFRRRMHQQIARSTPSPSRWNFLVPGAVAATVLLVIVMLFAAHTRRAGTLAEVADLHINALASANPLDVVSTDRHTVKPWFQGRIPFAFNVPEFSGTEFTLLGGRMVYLHQRPGAQLFVAMKQHKISVLIFQESPALDGAFPLTGGVQDLNSFGVETWQSNGLRFFVIGDSDPTEIDKLAHVLKQANQ